MRSGRDGHNNSTELGAREISWRMSDRNNILPAPGNRQYTRTIVGTIKRHKYTCLNIVRMSVDLDESCASQNRKYKLENSAHWAGLLSGITPRLYCSYIRFIPRPEN
jgi:hypothetical protein